MDQRPDHHDPQARNGASDNESDDGTQSESTPAEQQQRFQQLTRTLNIGIFRTSGDPAGRFIDANSTFIEMLGYGSKAELQGIAVTDLYQDPEDRNRFIDKLKAEGFVKNEAISLRKKDGIPFIGSVSTVAEFDEAGAVLFCDGILEDISEQKQAEAALLDNESKFRNLFDLSPQAIALIHLATARIVDINDKFCDVFRYAREEIIGNSPTGLGFYSEADRKIFLNELEASGEVQNLEMDFTAKDGTPIHARMFSRLVHINGDAFILTIFHDLTKQKQLEVQFHQAQKLEALGTLACGIAHDFNNLLMAIQGNVSLAMLQTDADQPQHSIFKNIEKQVQRGAKLNRQLLGYAQKGNYEVKPIHMNRLIEETSETFGRTKKEILIQRTLSDGIYTIEADRGQIEQVLLNLFVNAADAMPDGGTLRIETRNISHEDIKGKPYVPRSGNYVMITVTDTGTGIDGKTRERIFDPFFTTKKMGRGTGLGLASVYGIIKSHGGYIDVASVPEKFTTFTIYLPVSGGDQPGLSESAAGILKGTETILVVDDEDVVLDVSCLMLGALGYNALRAHSGKTALEIFEGRKDQISLVVLDIVMPDMNGRDVYAGLKHIQPDVVVLLTSGYTVDGEATLLLEAGCRDFIQKPFKLEAFSRKIRDSLDKSK